MLTDRNECDGLVCYEQSLLRSVLKYLKTKSDFISYNVSYNKNDCIYRVVLNGNTIKSTLDFDMDKFAIKLTTEVLGCNYVIQIPNVYNPDIKFVIQIPNVYNPDIEFVMYKFIESYSCAFEFSISKLEP